MAKGNGFREAVTGDIGKIRLRGNSVASGETAGNKLHVDATVRGWRSLPKGNKGKKRKRKPENPQALCGSILDLCL